MSNGRATHRNEKYTMSDVHFWKITLCLGIGSFFTFAAMYAVQPLLPVFVNEFSVSPSEASLTLSLTIIGLIIGLIILGILSDRMGRTVFIKLSLFGSVIPFFIMPLADSFLILLGLRLLQGFALAGLPAASLAYISEEIEQRSAGVATGLYISSNALGGMIGRVMTGYLTDHFSWQTAFFALAVVGIVIVVAVYVMLPKSRFFQPSHLPFAKDMEGFLFHLKNPTLLLVFGLGVVLQFSFSGIWTYLPFYLQDPPFSLSIEAISYMFFAYGFGIIVSPIAGWLAGHLGLSRVRMAGVFILTIGIVFTISSSLLFIVIGLCVLCLGFFTAHSLTAASVSEYATHHKGSATSLYLVSYYIGVTFGSSALGPLWGSAGWSGVVLLTAIVPVVYVMIVKVFERAKV